MLEKGIKGTQSVIVEEKNTAREVKSGTLPVFATPAMAALIEETAWKSIRNELEPGMGTVGGSLELKHLSPTPVGMKVTCVTELTAVEGKKLTFHAEVEDEAGKIGEAEHVRFIIEEEKFLKKAEAKKENA